MYYCFLWKIVTRVDFFQNTIKEKDGSLKILDRITFSTGHKLVVY